MKNQYQEKTLVRCPDCAEIVLQKTSSHSFRIRKDKFGKSFNVDLEFQASCSSVTYTTCPFCNFKWPYVTLVPKSSPPMITLRLT